MERWLLINASQALAFLCAAGLVTCLVRLRKSDHPAHLIAFALMLAGTLVREIVVYFWGADIWNNWPMLVSGFARDIQIIGALLFVRAVTVGRCGEWVWLGVALAAVLFAAVVP